MVYDGKTYRNLQDQVAYLTSMYKALGERIEEVAAQIPSKMIVEELPEEGDPLITYYVGPKGTEPNLYYEVWVWVQEEEDGPFVWRELEDTDQVDLSGYLPIQDGVTALPQVYGKTEAGDQAMLNVDIAATALTILIRDANGRTKVAVPSADGDAANKKYCDDGFVAKQTGVTAYPQAYTKNNDGTQDVVDIAVYTSPNSIVRRDGGGGVRGRNITPSDSSDLLTNKGYVDGNFLAKEASTTVYPKVYVKWGNGEQGTENFTNQAEPNACVRRNANGQVNVPQTPTENNNAASKKYVDDCVGQLLYLHDIEIIVTVDATNKLYIKAYLINGSSTAIASIDTATFKRMDVQYGCFGADVSTGAPCAVTKKPDSFVYGDFDEPRPSYLFQYITGGSLVSGVTNNSMTVTFTDTVISF